MKQYDTAACTIDAYNKNAHRYAAKFMDFSSYKEKILLFQKEYLPTHSSILDIGCGPGNNAKLLLENDPTYVIQGLDLSPAMVSMARENIPGAAFWVQDIREIKPHKTYDAIIASFCIVHLSDEETLSLIKKIAAMLRENGNLYLSFMEGKKAGLETTSFSEDALFFNYYQRTTIQKMLAEHDIQTMETLHDTYEEQDGSSTDDIFIFARKIPADHIIG